MKQTLRILGAAAMFCLGAQAQTNPVVFPPGKIAVFKAGTPDNNWPLVTSRVQPCFVQAFDTATTNQTSSNALVSVAMSTNSSVPGSVWINAHAGSEGGGLSRSVDRQFLALEGYTGNILSPTAAKPSTDGTVYRGIVTLDAFTNPISVYSSQYSWFGIPVGAASGTQDNPTGIASLDGTNFWGTGNFAGTSGELDGTLFYNRNVNAGLPVEVQNYLQAAGEARIIGGTLLVATKYTAGASASGLYNFVDPASGQVVPLPWSPNAENPYFNFTFTNLYLSWGSKFLNVLNFDMDAAHTVAYGADQTYGIVKFTNNAGTWVQAPYYFSTTNLGTLKQTSGNQGCFGICVDFSSTNPVIYATTMENGTPTNYVGGLGVNTAAGHQNNNRLIKIVDTGINPGTNLVAQTLAIAATTNEFFGGIDFTPDLRPLITTNPASYSTIPGSIVPFVAGLQSVYATSNQWFIIGTNTAFPGGGTNLIPAETGTTITNLNNDFTIDTNYSGNIIIFVATNNYGAVTSSPAILTVTTTAVAPLITSSLNAAAGFINGGVVFAPVNASGTQPFTYQWYYGGNALVDGPNPNADGSVYIGCQTASLTITNLQLTEAGSYYLVVANAAGDASNKVDVLTVNYHPATISAGQPASVTTFVGTPTSLNADESGATLPVTYQWYQGTNALSSSEYGNTSGSYAGTGSATLTINATTTADTATNYYIVYSNGAGSVTSSVAAVTVITPPAHSVVNYSNQVYTQTFDVLPDPGSAGIKTGLAQANGVSVNSINNPLDPGTINGVAYSLANPFDFAYPVILSSYLGGLGLTTGSTNIAGTPGSMYGWYGAADTNAADGVDTISRFGAQAGDQSTGGVIDFGPLDVSSGLVGTNRALGLLSTGTTGSTAFGLKLVNNSTNTLNYISLNFLGELWRNNKSARTLSFSYAVDPTANSFVLQSEPVATNATPQLIPGTIRVPSLAFSFPTNDGSILAIDGTQPTNQVSLVASNLALSTPWSPNAALWLVWSINYYGQGSGQGYAIDNLKFSASVLPTTLVQPIKITSSSVAVTGSGATAAASFSFTNAPGLTFSVRATNNLTAPKPTWPVIGTVTDSVTPGQYQFVDPNPSTNGALFYIISEP